MYGRDLSLSNICLRYRDQGFRCWVLWYTYIVLGEKDTYSGFKDDIKQMRMFSLTELLSIVMSQNLFAHGEQGPTSAQADI